MSDTRSLSLRELDARQALREVVTNGEWRGPEWVISTAVYEMAQDAAQEPSQAQRCECEIYQTCDVCRGDTPVSAERST